MRPVRGHVESTAVVGHREVQLPRRDSHRNGDGRGVRVANDIVEDLLEDQKTHDAGRLR